ncbi:MAG: SAM-dependent methyltransferase, partial [Limnohabitans sp.]
MKRPSNKQPSNKQTSPVTVSEGSPWPPEVRAGQSIGLLQRLHILTREGKLNQDSRRKLKQVYHLVGFIEKPLQALL